MPSAWCRADRGRYRPIYDEYVKRNGGQRTRAVCAVARKLVPLLLAIMQSGEPFDEARWRRSRRVRPYREE